MQHEPIGKLAICDIGIGVSRVSEIDRRVLMKVCETIKQIDGIAECGEELLRHYGVSSPKTAHVSRSVAIGLVMEMGYRSCKFIDGMWLKMPNNMGGIREVPAAYHDCRQCSWMGEGEGIALLNCSRCSIAMREAGMYAA